MNSTKTLLTIVMLSIMVLGTYDAVIPNVAHAAAAGPTPQEVAEQCTDIQGRKNEIFGAGGGASGDPGILTSIYVFIKSTVGNATQQMYTSLIRNANFKYAVTGAITLYVVTFGVFFAIGVVQASFGQLLVRLIKLGLIFAALSPNTGWFFFNEYVVKFFNNGTDEIVRNVIAIGTGVPVPAYASPFVQLDSLASFLIHPETIVALMGASTAGPFAMGMTGLMAIAFFGFFKMLINCLQTYAVAFVMRSILLAIGPIFIVFLLFERTKNLFNGWLNMVVSTSLQPILLFTFMSFMLVMIESATKNMMNVELCWMTTEAGTGVSAQQARWVFIQKNAAGESIPLVLEFTSEGNRACDDGDDCGEFPIKIIDVLTFLILIWITQRFSEVIDRIASELSNTTIALDPAGQLQQFINNQASGGGGGMFGGNANATNARPPRTAPPSTAPRNTPGQ